MSYQHVGMDGASPFVPASMAEGRGKSSDRRVDNESLVKGEEDRLAFSKKGRPVQYTPHTLAEYQRENPRQYVELGLLGADLDSEELVAKRAVKARVKVFSEQLRRVNLKDGEVPATTAASTVPAPPPPAERVAARAQRERALEFAKRVPKPKPAARLPEPGQGHREARGDGDSDSGRGHYYGSPEAGTLVSRQVEELEARHAMLKHTADAIRREMGF